MNHTNFQPILVPFELISGLSTTFCALANFWVILATYRASELRNKCSYLIAILATSDFVSSCMFVYTASAMALGFHFVPNTQCAYHQVLLIFSLNFGNFMIFAVGLDRLLCMSIPEMYRYARFFRKTCYLPFMVFLGLCFSFSHVLMLFLYTSELDLVPVCVVPTAYRGPSLIYFICSNFVLNLAVILVYYLAYREAHQQTPQEINNRESQCLERRRYFLNSLIIVMVVYLACYFLSFFTLLLNSIITSSKWIKFHVDLYVGLLVGINLGSNAVIYGIRSKEYRREFVRIFGIQNHTNCNLQHAHAPRARRSWATIELRSGGWVSRRAFASTSEAYERTLSLCNQVARISESVANV